MDPAPKPSPSRWSMFGDVWLRFFNSLIRHCPRCLEPVILCGGAAIITIIAKTPRRSIASNVGILLGHRSLCKDWHRAYRVFKSYLTTLLDGIHVANGHQQRLQWSVVGEEHFQAIQQEPGGCILLTAHMGSYDIAAPHFASQFGKKLNAVRMPERTPELQAYMDQTRQKMQSSSFEFKYNHAETVLGLELVQSLLSGQIVAIQGDRVLGGVSPTTVEQSGIRWTLPRGPFVLAATTQSPIYPMFLTRLGPQHYQIQFHAPILQTKPTSKQDRQIQEARVLQEWTTLLHQQVRQHWDQWMVLEQILAKIPAAEG